MNQRSGTDTKPGMGIIHLVLSSSGKMWILYFVVCVPYLMLA